MPIIIGLFCLAVYGTAGYHLEECYSKPECHVSNVDMTNPSWI